MQKAVIRAIDVGYGHVKWTDGKDPTGLIICDSFPSQTVKANDKNFDSGVLRQRDTVTTTINEVTYEVGRDIRLAIGKNNELEELDENFVRRDTYGARLYGALHYMLPTLGPSRTIDYLILGLPMSTIGQHSSYLSNKFVGKHTVNSEGDIITINKCAVYAQPLGGYAAYLAHPTEKHTSPPISLVVDIGYNTVDWVVCENMDINTAQAASVNRGMSGVLREIAKALNKSSPVNAQESNIVRMLDQYYTTKKDFRLAGQHINIEEYVNAGNEIMRQAAQAVRNHVGAGENIDIIIVSGGGARMYAPFLKEQFPAHKQSILAAPNFAIVRGFHFLGDLIADRQLAS